MRKLKQEAFDSLKQNGFQIQEIANALNMSERQLYRWQAEGNEAELSEETEDGETQEKIGDLEDRVESLTWQLKTLRRQLDDKKVKERTKAKKEIEEQLQAQRLKDKKRDQERQKKTRQIQKLHEISEKNAVIRERERS